MVMDYEIHLPEYLSKCINKDKPELHCNGKCVLMEKIKEKEQNEAKKNMVVYEYSALYVHKEQTVFSMYQPNEEISDSLFLPYLISYRFYYHTAIFRPPVC